jgi:hypothetical protein
MSSRLAGIVWFAGWSLIVVAVLVIGILMERSGADLTMIIGVLLPIAGAIIIPLVASLSRSRSASSSARDAADASGGLASAHYPRARLLRGLWPGADRRYTP